MSLSYNTSYCHYLFVGMCAGNWDWLAHWVTKLCFQFLDEWVRTADKSAQTRVVRPSSKSDIGHSLPNESCIPLQFLFSWFCLYASGSFKWVELEKCFFSTLAVPPAKWVVQKINLKESLVIWTIDLWSRELRPYPKKTYSFNIQSEG